VPVHVDLEGEFLYGYATVGQKIEWMRQNPLVCLESDELIAHGRWTSVVVFGQYEELPNTPEHAGPRGVAERLFQRHPMWWEPASVPLAEHERRRPVVFRIRISRMTGRRAGPVSVNTEDGGRKGSGPKGSGWIARALCRLRTGIGN
jgi:nitroimidazol reductase NimA-like FMN-containing flavoprotein (pyridoxamine 5'-phosphate oxidase superfamily)